MLDQLEVRALALRRLGPAEEARALADQLVRSKIELFGAEHAFTRQAAELLNAL